jgi:hypothetical protein
MIHGMTNRMGIQRTQSSAHSEALAPSINWMGATGSAQLSGVSCSRLIGFVFLPRLYCGLPLSLPRVDRAVQRDFGDLQCPANLRNGVFGIIIEGLGNPYLSLC